MPKTKISEFSATPANNTDIDSINIAEGCAPSGINDAIRELMAQLKDFQTGAVGDSFNGPVGTSTAAAGAFTTLAASGAVTISGGTANGVTYLNGSKVLTSGSALQFDGTSLFVGATSAAAGKLVVKDTASSNTVWLVGRTSDGASSVSFRNAADSAYTGRIELDPSVGMLVGTTGATTQLTLSNTGNLGLGVTPSAWRSTIKATQIGQSASVYSNTNANSVVVASNDYVDSAGADRYIATGYSTLYQQVNGQHQFYTAASGTAGNAISFTQAMTLDANGNLGVGATSITPRDSGARTLELYGTSSGRTAIKFTNSTSGTGATDGMFLGYDDNLNFSIVNNESGVITFGTSNTERARIDSSGNLLVGSTNAAGRFYSFTSSNQWALYGEASSSALNSGLLALVAARNTTNNTFKAITYYNSGAGADRFYVTDGGAVYGTGAYNQISDGRLKENVKDLDIGLSSVLNLQPRFFDWKSGKGSDTKNNVGFIAQEVEVVLPHSVTEWTNSQGDPTVYKAVSMESMIPVLVKAIQEQQSLIQSLKARLDAANL